MGNSSDHCMKEDMIARCPQVPEILAQQRQQRSVPLHDFNVEGMIANHFGQGDGCEAVDPMRDPSIIEVSPRPKRSA